MCSKKTTGEKGGRREMVASVDATLSSDCRRGGAPFNDAHHGVVVVVLAPLGWWWHVA
jgi:hypothetical protein